MKKEVKIAYFPSTTSLTQVMKYNGTILDNYCTKCETEENLNTGGYILDATFLLEVQDYLQEETILKVMLDYGDELFRISKVTKGTRYVDIVARQITISDTLNLYLDKVTATNATPTALLASLSKSAQGVSNIDTNIQGGININTKVPVADDIIKNSPVADGIQGSKEIILYTDLAGSASVSVSVSYQNMSLYKALHDGDNSFVNKFGGEICRRRNKVSFLNRVGSDNKGIVIREGKNLTGFNGTSDFDNVITRARGRGANGITGNWWHSNLIKNYAMVYSKTIEYSDVKVRGKEETEGYGTENEAKAELDKRIQNEFTTNQIDKPRATYQINFVDLAKTEEYKDYAVAESVELGDTIRVYVPRINTDIKVRAVIKKYDILTQRTKELTLSNAVEVKAMGLTMSGIIADLKNQYASSGSNSMDQYITSVIKSGMKDSYVVIRDNELLIMDNTDINQAKKVCRYNKEGLAFSKDGYYGTYTSAFTIGGVINADLITTGTLNADLIKAGKIDTSLLQAGAIVSPDNSIGIDLDVGAFKVNNSVGNNIFTANKTGIVINLDNSTFDIMNKAKQSIFTAGSDGSLAMTGTFSQSDISGLKSIEISNNRINIYDYKRDGDFIGSLMSETTGGNTYGRLLLCADNGNPLDLGIFNADDTYQKYVTLNDNNDEMGAVSIQKWCDFKSDMTFSQNKVAYGFLKLDSSQQMWLCSNGDASKKLILGNRINPGTLRGVVDIFSDAGNTTKGMKVDGTLSVTGTKNRIVETKDYGVVALGAYETTEPYFGDIGEGVISEDGLCYIYIDQVFIEAVNTNCSYQVFLQKYGQGDVYVFERNENYFIVQGTPGLRFGWEIKAKQKGYETDRLEVSDKAETEVFDDEILIESAVTDTELDKILEGEEIIYD